MAADHAAGLLVPVTQSVTLRPTVDYAIEQLLDRREGDAEPAVHFVFVAPWRAGDPDATVDREQATDLLAQIETWARYNLESADVDPETVEITTAVVGEDDYLFGPADYVDLLSGYATQHELTHVVVDPEYSLTGQTTLLQPFEFELQQRDLTVEEAPVDRPTQRGRLLSRPSPVRFLTLFGVSFLFYQVLGGFSGLFDIVTGVATALIVALTLSSVSFYRDPTLRSSPRRLVRGVIYIPYLLYEIVVSNLVVARVILDPRIDIDPRLTKIQVFVGSGLPLTTLANSITLTPGTLTVRADDQELYVHSLVPFAREGLFEGSLERWVRFVFYGREAARFPTPRERGDTEVLQEPAGADATAQDGSAIADGGDTGAADGGSNDAADGGDESAPADGGDESASADGDGEDATADDSEPEVTE